MEVEILLLRLPPQSVSAPNTQSLRCHYGEKRKNPKNPAFHHLLHPHRRLTLKFLQKRLNVVPTSSLPQLPTTWPQPGSPLISLSSLFRGTFSGNLIKFGRCHFPFLMAVMVTTACKTKANPLSRPPPRPHATSLSSHSNFHRSPLTKPVLLRRRHVSPLAPLSKLFLPSQMSFFMVLRSCWPHQLIYLRSLVMSRQTCPEGSFSRGPLDSLKDDFNTLEHFVVPPWGIYCFSINRNLPKLDPASESRARTPTRQASPLPTQRGQTEERESWQILCLSPAQETLVLGSSPWKTKLYRLGILELYSRSEI